MRDSTSDTGGNAPVIVLHSVEAKRLEHDVRWRFELRAPGKGPVLLAVRSTRSGLVHDIQQLGRASETEWPRETWEGIADRVREELARASLVAALSGQPGRREWAA